MFAVPVNRTVTLPSGRKTSVAAVARLIPPTARETRSCGRGCKGHRGYQRARAATSPPRHWVLTRRSLSDPDDLAFSYCQAPAGRPVSLPILIRVAGKRWPVEECFLLGRGQAGLDQHQVRLWHSFHRRTVLSVCARALLAVAAARPAPPGRDDDDPPAAAQPAACRDTGKLPASADDQPPENLGLVKVSARGPPPGPPGRRAHEPRRPRPRLRLVTMAATPAGPSPMAPLPRPVQGRPRHLTPAGRKEALT